MVRWIRLDWTVLSFFFLDSVTGQFFFECSLALDCWLEVDEGKVT